MSAALFRKDFRAHFFLVLLVCLVLAMYMSIIIGMYNVQGGEFSLMESMEAFNMPPELLSAMGFTQVVPGLTGLISAYLYGMLMLAFPLVLETILGNRLVAAMVDKGSMAAILASPVTRKKTAATQALFFIAVVVFMFAAVTLMGLLFSAMRFPGELDTAGFLKINLGAVCLHLALAGISFFFSCLFSDTGRSLLFGAGLPIAFLLLHMLSGAGEKLSWMKNFTIFSLFSPNSYLAGGSMAPDLLVLLAIASVLFIGGIFVFDRKDLPL